MNIVLFSDLITKEMITHSNLFQNRKKTTINLQFKAFTKLTLCYNKHSTNDKFIGISK